MFKSPFDYPGTAILSLIVSGGACLCAFFYTLGIDISHPQAVYAGIVPLVWHIKPTGVVITDFWHMVGSGFMTCLCLIARLVIAAVAAAIIGYVLFLILALFVGSDESPQTSVPKLSGN